MHFDWNHILLLIRLVLDILFVWGLLYAGIRIIRNNNRTIQILKGLIAVFLIKLLAMTLNLQGANVLIGTFLNWGVILVMIILQPEIRGMLEKMGKTNTLFSSSIPTARTAAMIDELMTAVENMSRSKTGALITIQMNQSMQDYEETGIPMDSDVSSELLETIFQYGTPMHDGAVIIEGDKIATAAAYYPSTSKDLPSKYGARHRAAVGISEATDSITLVVSEETGNISVANRGVLTQYSPQALRRFLTNKLIPEENAENTSVLMPVINTVRSYSNQLLPGKTTQQQPASKTRSDDRVKPMEVVDMRLETLKKEQNSQNAKKSDPEAAGTKSGRDSRQSASSQNKPSRQSLKTRRSGRRTEEGLQAKTLMEQASSAHAKPAGKSADKKAKPESHPKNPKQASPAHPDPAVHQEENPSKSSQADPKNTPEEKASADSCQKADAGSGKEEKPARRDHPLDILECQKAGISQGMGILNPPLALRTDWLKEQTKALPKPSSEHGADASQPSDLNQKKPVLEDQKLLDQQDIEAENRREDHAG